MVVRKRQIEKKKKKKSIHLLSRERIKLRLEFVSFSILVTIIRKSFGVEMRTLIL